MAASTTKITRPIWIVSQKRRQNLLFFLIGLTGSGVYKRRGAASCVVAPRFNSSRETVTGVESMRLGTVSYSINRLDRAEKMVTGW
jgi:hypothetical protein